MNSFFSVYLCFHFLFCFQIKNCFATSHDRPQVASPASSDELAPAAVAGAVGLEEAFVSHGRHPLDAFSLLKQRVYPFSQGFLRRTWQRLRRNYVDPKKIAVEIEGAIAVLYRTPHISESVSVLSSSGKPFSISFQGRKLLDVEGEITSIAFFGNYLIFVEKQNLDSKQKIFNLSFIDLSTYGKDLGFTEVPIFRLPIADIENVPSLKVLGNRLQVGETNLTPQVFEAYSDVQQLSFNINAALVDPNTFPQTDAVVSDLIHSFNRMMDLVTEDMAWQAESGTNGAKNLFVRFVASEKAKTEKLARVTRSLKPQAKEQREETIQRLGASLETHEAFQKTLKAVATRQSQQKKLTARLEILWARLSLPQSNQAPRIKQALGLMVGGFKRLLLGKKSPEIVEGTLQLLHSKFFALGGAALAASVAFGFCNESFAPYVSQAFQLVQTVGQTLLGKVNDAAILVKDSVVATFSGFNPYIFTKAYLSEENFPKVATGMTAAFTALFIILGTPHFIVNSFMLVRDLWSKRKDMKGSLFRRFIDRQNAIQDTYLKNLSESEAAAHSTATIFTDDQNAEAAKIVSELREKEKGWVGRCLGAIKKWPGISSFFGKTEAKKMSNFFQALMHFCFSSASLTLSGKTYLKIWNSWFAFRSFIWHPLLCMTFLYYPNYYRRALFTNLNGIHPPTELNGGYRPAYEEYLLRFTNLFGDSQLTQLREWEAKIVPLEEQVTKAAFQAAFRKLLEFTKEVDQLKELVSNGGITGINDLAYHNLHWAQRHFIMIFVSEVQARVIPNLLSGLVDRLGLGDGARDAASLKTATLKLVEELNFSESDVSAEVEKAVSDPEVFQLASDHVRNNGATMTGLRDYLAQRKIEKLAPVHHRQVRRLQVVEKQLDNGQAMARAVRATKASFIVDKPMELFLLFVCLAGVTSGINVPIHDEMFGPNSWFHLGKYAFLTGYLSGVTMGVFSDIWMKVQQDAKNEGSFDADVPEGKDKKKSFFGWYRRMFFDKDKTLLGSWWENQKYMNQLVFANIKAAFVTMCVISLLTLGRFDLDMYLLGYFVSFCAPLNGMALMIEQAFEKTIGYFKKDIPKEYWSHPEAQQYINDHMGKARLTFNIFYKLYENVVGFLMQNMETITSGRLGTRSMARLLCFGYTPTEIAVGGLMQIENLNLPGVSWLARKCVRALTKNMTD